MLPTAVLLLTLGCRATAPIAEPAPTEPAHHGEPGEHGHHGPDHFTDPARYVPAWNAPDRDAWQKPEEIVAALGLRPGDTVVDLGAGTGYLLPPLSAAVGPTGTVVALDIEPSMLAFLDEARAKEGWTNVRTHAAALDDPRLPAGGAHAIVTLNVWHHVEAREAYAAKVAAALAPGGAFVIVDFLKAETEGFGPPLAMRLTAEQIVAELTAGGLTAEIVPETMPRHYIVRGIKPRP
jgi:cyclopropane fatty-acyl-phospholipid synthase-like methyltransferase